MKKCIFSLLAVAAMAAVSCVKENNPEAAPQENQNLVEVTLTAGTETKAAFDSENYPQIKWEGNESIAVLGATTGNKEFTTTSTGATAEFTGLASLTDDVLYAVYPYDANVTLSGENLVGVTVPAVQTATAGSFDPKAYVAVAKCTDKTTLSFKSLVSFLKFSLDADAAANAKSVTVVANNGTENLACTSGATSVTSLSHASPYTNVSTSVTLKGDFASGKDYFMTIRPNDIDGGITLYVEYADGSIYKKSTTNTLFPTAGQRRNHVLPLGIIKKTDLVPLTAIEAYQADYELIIAGTTYKKSVLGLEATHITKSTVNKSITSKGVYFIDSDVDDASISGTFTADVFVIGNNFSSKSRVSVTNTVKWNSTTVAFKNLSITDGTDADMFKANSAGGTLLFDNCAMTTDDDKTQLIYSSADMNRIAFYNSDINVLANNKYIANVTSAKTIANLDFVNNIIYSADRTIRYQFKFIVGNPNITNLTVTNNTIAEVLPYTYGKVSENYTKIGTLNKLNFSNNLFYVPTYSDEVESAVISVSPTVKNVSNNNMYKSASATNKLKVVDDVYVTTTTDENSLVKSKDLANGVIVPQGTCGATR